MAKIIDLDTAAGADNPSSIHASGVQAGRVLNDTRSTVAEVLKVHTDEIVFTSGGTESNNLAIFGIAKSAPITSRHIITSMIEHASILEPCRELERQGFFVTYLPVNKEGLISSDDLVQALRPETTLVSIGYANNEIGTIQPIRELTKVIRRFRIVQHRVSHKLCDTRCCTIPYFHTDACQAPRFLDCRVSTLGVDLMTLNSSKIYGPKGAGSLYVRRGINLSPLIYGGGQERGRRSGTENVPAIVGFATALTLCTKLREKELTRLTKLRDYFIDRLLKLSGVTLNGSRASRLPNNINVSFSGADSEFVVLSLDAAHVAASVGSACSVHEKSTSHVIMALGNSEAKANSAVRFTLAREIKKADLDYVLKILPDILKLARIV